MVSQAQKRKERKAADPNRYFKGSPGTSAKPMVSPKGKAAFAEIDRIRAGTSKLPQTQQARQTPQQQYTPHPQFTPYTPQPQFTPYTPATPHTPIPSSAPSPNMSTPSGPVYAPPPPTPSSAPQYTPHPQYAPAAQSKSPYQSFQEGLEKVHAFVDQPGAAAARAKMAAGQPVTSEEYRAAIDYTGRFGMSGGLGKVGITGIKGTLGPAIGKIAFKDLVKAPLQPNTKNVNLIKKVSDKITKSITWKGLGAAAIAMFIADKVLERSLGGKNFGEFLGMEEASQSIMMPGREALVSGNLEAYYTAAKSRDEVLQKHTFWEELASYIPFYNVGSKLEDYRKTAVTASSVYDMIAEDMQMSTTEENREASIYSIRREQKEASEAKIVDYFNEQSLITQEAKIAAEKEATLAANIAWWEHKQKERALEAADLEKERLAYIKMQKELAAFWAKEKAKQRILETAAMEATAAFWKAYREEAAKLKRDSMASQLVFGLL